MDAKKTDIARAIVRDRRFPIKTVAKALSVARSNLYRRPDELSCIRGTYIKLVDRELLSLIIEIVDERPTDHTKTKARHPQTNGICERFHKTILQEFYQTAFRRKLYSSLEEL